MLSTELFCNIDENTYGACISAYMGGTLQGLGLKIYSLYASMLMLGGIMFPMFIKKSGDHQIHYDSSSGNHE